MDIYNVYILLVLIAGIGLVLCVTRRGLIPGLIIESLIVFAILLLPKFDNIMDETLKTAETDIITIVNSEENKDLNKKELINEIEKYLNNLIVDGYKVSVAADKEYGTLDSNNINIDYALKIESKGIYDKKVINIKIDDKNNRTDVEINKK